MTLNNIPQFISASDRSILVKFGEEISDKIHQQVFIFYRFVLKKQIKGVINIHPAYATILFSGLLGVERLVRRHRLPALRPGLPPQQRRQHSDPRHERSMAHTLGLSAGLGRRYALDERVLEPAVAVT